MLFPEIPPFDYAPRTRIVYGAGELARLGELATEIGGRNILLVTDPGLRDAGHEARALSFLREAQLNPVVFDDVQPNPTTDDVERGTRFARDHQIELIIGLGGGSSLDCAKGINFLLTNGGRVEDYWGAGKATRPMLPLIAVPTTAGTGSEAQSYAVISQAKTHLKMACGDKKAAPRVALLDPELTLTMPALVTAVTGIDAISHALESHVTNKRNVISAEWSRRAWSLLRRAFPQVISNPDDVATRGAMLLGAHFAGAAIESSMLGATHAMANPLSARYGLTHGIAIGILLPHVIRFNAPVCSELYAELEDDLDDISRRTAAGQSAGTALAAWVEQMVRRTDCPTSLQDCDLDDRSETTLRALAAEASKQWTGLANPRPVSPDEFESLYRLAGF